MLVVPRAGNPDTWDENGGGEAPTNAPIRKCNNSPGAPHPRFPVQLSGFRELHAPFLKERRTRSLVERRVQEIRGISLVFREMWDSALLNLQPWMQPMPLRFVIQTCKEGTCQNACG
jgi:hypothetical protein